MSRAARGWTGGSIAGVLLAAAGVLLLVALGRSIANAAPFEPSPDYYQGRAQALVLDVNPEESYDGRGVDVEFTADGAVKVADVEIDHGVLPQRGDRIAIAYDTDDPDDAVLVTQLSTGGSAITHDGGNAALAFSGLGCGVAAIVVGILTIVWARRAPSRKAQPAPAYGYGGGYGVPYGLPGYGAPYGSGPPWYGPPAYAPPYGVGPPAPGQEPPGPLPLGVLPGGRPAAPRPPEPRPPEPRPPEPDPAPQPPPQPPDPDARPDGPASPWGGPG